jgi:hypothetical protein
MHSFISTGHGNRDLSLVADIFLSDSEKYASYVWGLHKCVTDSKIQRRQKITPAARRSGHRIRLRNRSPVIDSRHDICKVFRKANDSFAVVTCWPNAYVHIVCVLLNMKKGMRPFF